MIRGRVIPVLAGLAALGGCSSQAERTADRLDDAAVQSDPSAAAVLSNEADAIRNSGSEATPADAGSPAQEALENAGAAQTRTPPAPQP